MTMVLTGLDIEEKAARAETMLFDLLGGKERFAEVDVRLIRTDRPDAPTNEQATAQLRITVADPDPGQGRPVVLERHDRAGAGRLRRVPHHDPADPGERVRRVLADVRARHGGRARGRPARRAAPRHPARTARPRHAVGREPAEAATGTRRQRPGQPAGLGCPGRPGAPRSGWSAARDQATRAATPTSACGPGTRRPTAGCGSTWTSRGSASCCPKPPASRSAGTSCRTCTR